MADFTRWRRLAPAVTTALVFLATAWFLRQVPWRSILVAISAAHGEWLVLAVALNYVLIVLRGVALRYLVAPVALVSISRAVRYTLASITGNIIAPFRAGIALRAWLLLRYEQVSLSNNVAVFLFEKIADIAVLLALSAVLPWLLPTFPRWALGSIVLLLALVIAVAAIGLTTRSKLRLGERIRGYVAPIARVDTLLLVGVTTLAIWLVDALMVMTTLKAVGAPSTLGIAILILLAINIAITVPTPANGGTLELGAVFALHAVGVEPGKAIAFAILYHAAQVFPTLAIGICDGPMLWQTRRRRAAESIIVEQQPKS